MRLYQIRIQNFRGIEDLTIDLDSTTVLIGENNSGKTTILEAVSLCLGKILSGRSVPFSEFDYHRASSDVELWDLPPIELHFRFREFRESEWPDGVVQGLDRVLQVRPDNLQEVRFYVKSFFDEAIGDFGLDTGFLDLEDNRLRGGTSQITRDLQLLTPAFLLRAVRDPTLEFGSRSQFWKAFTKNPDFATELVEEIEGSIAEINRKVLDAHGPFEEVKEGLKKTGMFVPLGTGELVSIEAVPAKIHELLDRTQIQLASSGNVRLPIRHHGAGTQSLAIIFLFEAFLKNRLADDFDTDTEPLLAIEEPESHLHPSAVKTLWTEIAAIRGQKLVATHSGELMSAVPLASIRRLARKEGKTRVFQVRAGLLSPEDERKIGYHIRAKRGNLLFARVWLFVEGESEYWFLPEAARLLGADLERQGVCCVEFTQVGLETLLKIAIALGIEWHVFVDGDQAGTQYSRTAEQFLGADTQSDRITRMREKDLEHCLWQHGYSSTYIDAAGGLPATMSTTSPTPAEIQQTIKKACKAESKPGMALRVIAAAAEPGSVGFPIEITDAITLALRYAAL